MIENILRKTVGEAKYGFDGGVYYKDEPWWEENW